MLPYIIVRTFVDMAHIGDILDPSHIVKRSIRFHTAYGADAWAILIGNSIFVIYWHVVLLLCIPIYLCTTIC